MIQLKTLITKLALLDMAICVFKYDLIVKFVFKLICLLLLLLLQSVRITQKELRRKSKQSYRRCRSYRPAIQHVYDTDTQLVLKLCVKHARRSRPKLDKSHFEHPKRTVIYNQSNTDETADDSLVYSNNTITSVKIQQNRFGLILPILIVTSILMFAAFSVVFALLMRPSS